MAPPKTLKSKPKPQQRHKKPSARNAKPGAINTWDDTIEEGGADEFHKNRDKVLLEDTTGSSNLRRALGQTSDDEFFDEEEVFRPTYTGPDEEDELEGAEVDDDDEVEPAVRKERKRVLKERASKGVIEPAKGRFAKPDPTSSDDDDDAASDDDDADGASAAGGQGSSEESEEENWGSNPSAYYARPSARRGRDEVDSDSDDEALAERRMLEEKEVRLQQRRAREGMAKGDWGLDDLAEGEDDGPEAKEDESAAAVPAAPETTDPDALLAHLRRHSPETLALAREWPALIERLPTLAGAIASKTKEDPEYKGLGMMSLHYQTYLTYTTTLAFYFHLAALPAETRPNLQTHPVLQRLLQLKEALSQMENLDFAGDADDESDPDEFAAGFEGESFLDGSDEDDDNVDDDDDEDEDELLALGGPMDGKRDAAAERAWRQQMLEGLEEGELEELMAEMARMQRGEAGPMDDDDEMSDELPAPVKPAKKSKAKAAEGKQVKKAKTPAAPAFPTIDEPTPSFSSTSSKPRKAAKASSSKLLAGDDEDALAEPTTLSAPDSSAKDAAKHSLRFHTSKIESAASRRASARSGRMGGDDDVPYRNKQAGRDAALRKNSGAGAGANGDGDDLDGEEWGEADRAAAKAVRDMDGGLDLVDDDGDDDGGDAGEGDDGYYQLVKKRKREEKEDKQAAYDEAREEERFVEDESATGPRSLTRAILKNKGLTPSRSKAVRNPRVKKRMRFDKAKKQVASKQAVYTGGQSALKGSYGGEATGISQVVKSRKF